MQLQVYVLIKVTQKLEYHLKQTIECKKVDAAFQ